MVNDEELITYFEKGIQDDILYLTVNARKRYLCAKDVISLTPQGEIRVKRSSDGKYSYIKWNEEIDKALRRIRYKEKGRMGVNIEAIEKDVNKLDKVEITKLKQHIDDINPDEIDF